MSGIVEGLVGSLLAAEITVMVLATIAVGLRLLARNIRSNKMGADDYLIIFSLVGPMIGRANLLLTLSSGHNDRDMWYWHLGSHTWIACRRDIFPHSRSV